MRSVYVEKRSSYVGLELSWWMHHYRRDRAEKVCSSIKNCFLVFLIGILGELSAPSNLKFDAHYFIRCVIRLKYSSQ